MEIFDSLWPWIKLIQNVAVVCCILWGAVYLFKKDHAKAALFFAFASLVK